MTQKGKRKPLDVIYPDGFTTFSTAHCNIYYYNCKKMGMYSISIFTEGVILMFYDYRNSERTPYHDAIINHFNLSIGDHEGLDGTITRVKPTIQ